jgi:putative two-component system response regulator
MGKILFISKDTDKWEDLARSLSDSYEFIFSKSGEDANFSTADIIATDDVASMAKISLANKLRLPLVFFGPANDFSKELQARRLGAEEYCSFPSNKELLLLRLKNLSSSSQLIKTNNEHVRWMRMIRRDMMSMQEGMVEIMAQIVENRDENTGGHIKRTATFISMLGEAFVENGTFTRDQLNLIVMAAPLHDIGKIGIRDQVLLKPGPLTDAERLEIMSHPAKGAAIVQKMQKRFESHTYLQYAYDIALNHHERFDGNGYPNGKKGDEIPFCARLMSVVDVYDALVSDRIYRKGMSKDKAHEIIFSGEGTQFDPMVLRAFEECKDYLI